MSPIKKNLPLTITWARMALVPLVLYGMSQEDLNSRSVAAFLFVVASASDWADGYFARKYNAITVMGQFLDPIADKILLTSVLIALIPTGRIDVWMVILLLARDTLINGLRQVAAAESLVISANPVGKWKTALQMIAIPAMIVGENFNDFPLVKIGFWVLWGSVVLSLTSGFQYWWAYEKVRRAKPKF